MCARQRSAACAGRCDEEVSLCVSEGEAGTPSELPAGALESAAASVRAGSCCSARKAGAATRQLVAGARLRARAGLSQAARGVSWVLLMGRCARVSGRAHWPLRLSQLPAGFCFGPALSVQANNRARYRVGGAWR